MNSIKTTQNSSVSISSLSSSCAMSGRKHSTGSTPPSSAGSSSSPRLYVKTPSSHQSSRHQQSTSLTSQQADLASESAIDDDDDCENVGLIVANNGNVTTSIQNHNLTISPPSDITTSQQHQSSTLSKKLNTSKVNSHHHRLPSYASSVTKSNTSQFDKSHSRQVSSSSILSLSSDSDEKDSTSFSSCIVKDPPKSKLTFAKKPIPTRTASLRRHNGTPLSRLTVNNSTFTFGMPNTTCPVHGPLNLSNSRRSSLSPSDLASLSSSSDSTGARSATNSSQNSQDSSTSTTSISSTNSNGAQPNPSCEDCMSVVREVQARAKAAIAALPKPDSNTTTSALQTVNKPFYQQHQPAEIKGRATLPRLNKNKQNSAHRDLFAPKDTEVPMSVEIGAHSAFVSTNKLVNPADRNTARRTSHPLAIATTVAEQISPSNTPNPGCQSCVASNVVPSAGTDADPIIDTQSCPHHCQSKPASPLPNASVASTATVVNSKLVGLNDGTMSHSSNHSLETNNSTESPATSKPASERVLPLLCVKAPPRLTLNLAKNDNSSTLLPAPLMSSAKQLKNPRFSAVSNNNSKAISLPSSPTGALTPVTSLSSAASARSAAVNNNNNNNNAPLNLYRNTSSSSLSTIQAVPASSKYVPRLDTRSAVAAGIVNGPASAGLYDSHSKKSTIGIHPTKKPMYTPSVLRRTMTVARLNTIGNTLGENDEETTEYYNYCNALTSRHSRKRTHKSTVSLRGLSSNTYSSESSIASLTASLSSSSLSSLGSSTLTRSSSFLDEPSKAHWKANSSSNSCNSCSTPFSLFNRRHHCRHCGELFCDKCSSYEVRLDPGCNFHILGQKVRACDSCFDMYKKFIDRTEDATDIHLLAKFSEDASLFSNLHSVNKQYSGNITLSNATGDGTGVLTPCNKRKGSPTATQQSGTVASFCISPVTSEHSSRDEVLSMYSSNESSTATSPVRNNIKTYNTQAMTMSSNSASKSTESGDNDDLSTGNLVTAPPPIPAGSLPPDWNWSTF